MSTRFVLAVSIPALLAASADVAAADVTWPVETFNRPLTMPGGTFQVGANLAAVSGVDASGDTALFDTVPLTLVAGYGIQDRLEVLATYGATLHDFEAKGTLRAGLGYAAVRGALGGRLEIIARADAGYDVLGEAVAPITVGPQVQLNLTPALALVTPGQFGSWLTIAVDGDDKPVTLDLPIGLLYQATPNLFAQVDARLATIGISDADSTVIGDDAALVNLTLGATPVNVLDIGLVLSADAKAIDDSVATTLFVRYYGI